MLRLLFSAFGMHAHRSPRIHCDGVELAGSADADTLVFFAMHFPRNASLDPTDVALLQWYYSTRFLRLYGARFWVRGIAAYEEIGLPVACTNESLSIVTTAGALTHPPRLPGGCDMAAFSAGAGVRNLKLAPHFQYRPAIACAEYADALRRGTNELWHPVKDRSCLPGIVSGL